MGAYVAVSECLCGRECVGACVAVSVFCVPVCMYSIFSSSSTIRYIPVGGKLPMCQLGLSFVISDQYSIRRLLTVFYYICRCVPFGVAGVEARIGWLTVGGHVLCAVWAGMCFIPGYVYLRVGCIFACFYMMTGWSPALDDSIDACMFVCVFSVFPLYIVIIRLCRFITLGQ